ncbi:MAG: PTS sugar transporter subunit IIA [Actinomyces ruminicola]|uniref:Ascorbate-specific PTS system EIIA component n=1 Tax=Actinomyces ruminicola TaxID=332524 RepID=A0A1G9V0V2_9ACTO|nr:PTS sugar transporter subunit IIA [Actinomyces ruminicola]MBE6483021.1 PTS sugar transporter subunit IIA [Actinomyces ruminicola]SDM65535.1 Phosphotransferase system mannitol/fructose-specific IIA domain (Ntr-type) [Actinomyces ruminicola]
MSTALTDLITNDHVIIHKHVATWQQAIAAVAQPLLADGSITAAYVDSMIDAVDRFGPYIALSPHLVLAHARPEAGVVRQAMSVMTLADPVNFNHPENDPVDIVFCLAAVDDDSHLKALREFVAIAGDRPKQERLVAAKTVDEFQQILREED